MIRRASIAKKHIHNCLSCLVVWLLLSPALCAGAVRLQLTHIVGKQPLRLDSTVYTNALGQHYTLSRFRYYISNLSFITTSGDTIHSHESYLIDEDEPTSKAIELTPLPSGSYRALRFIIGVDSLHNCSGLQEGALDPALGMFWAWNTGYIFLKLEGKSDASASSGNKLEYHIGGFKNENNCVMNVQLDFPSPVALDAQHTVDVEIQADVAQILTQPLDVDFRSLSSVTDHRHARTIALNYADMFSLRAIYVR